VNSEEVRNFLKGHIGTDGVAAAFSGYICTTTTGTFLGRPEKEIFWNAYIGWYEEAMALESVFMEQVDHGFSLLYDI